MDYHEDMNRETFLERFENQLLKNLKSPSVIIMDNASYHMTIIHKSPTSSSTKYEIHEWLTNNKINFDKTALKILLLELVRLYKPSLIYEADELADQYGRTVLRLQKDITLVI